MKIIEEVKLKDFITQVESFSASFPTPQSFYENVQGLKSTSLQSVSYKRDEAFFEEISALLNVILSIIAHPHLTNKREEVVVRIEQAKSLSPEDFKQVLKDSSLWKEHNLSMIPENIYYYQYVNELCIYENRFITLLVDLIEAELIKYAEFYLTLVPSVQYSEENAKGLDTQKVGKILQTVDRLKMRVAFIKSTPFYKIVSRSMKIERIIRPTNILLKDRLYRHCFRFYRKFVRYGDKNARIKDFRTYYLILLLKELKKQGYTLQEKSYNSVADKFRLALDNGRFGIVVATGNNNELVVDIGLKKGAGRKRRHLLFFDKKNVSLEENALTVEMLSIWDLFYADDGYKKAFELPHTEKELIASWLATKTYTVKGDRKIYEKICPVCKSKNVDVDRNTCSCADCKTEYVFEGARTGNIWFSKIRRR